ncbi:hypothetical protein SteCoe_1556 [Stentor coeruleus]|uniref:Uncharacterized protein n=1 Tax=Stentor coeruleus TaxID=5963 RepID=A0A1R2D1Q2_9CILI|nr:hypothetical protein SteCoe_1556 [Stentor coeruleus]
MTTPGLSPSLTRVEKPKLKKLIWRASQKDLKQWEEDLSRISKEEAFIKKTIRDLNVKYQKIIACRCEKDKEVSTVEDKKQKELERSLAHIDNLLRGTRKKYKNKFS